MSELQTIPTSVATLVGMPVVDERNHPLGRVHEFAVRVDRDSSRVEGFILRRKSAKGGTERLLLPVDQVALPQGSDRVLHAQAEPVKRPNMKEFLLLERDLLDQQIIDVDGRKVVRVNDVNLEWEKNGDNKVAGLLITQVEVGMRGASKRLLKGLPAPAVEKLAERFAARVIPWSCVDLIERDPARRVRLKIGQDRLAQLHPSDIAAILEELAPAEREAVFTSLPEETAAEALEEIDPKMQKALVQGLNHEHAADIIEEMDPGAAADLLNELTDEESEAILDEMEPEERQEVEELLEFSPDSAAGRMTTDFLSLRREETVENAVTALREFEGDPDTITEIYLVDEEHKLIGVVTLPRLLLARPGDGLETLAEKHNVSCHANANADEVAELFDKYNLRSLPVVDHHDRVMGAIHAEQVIAQLREG